jgi:hypothetical protein
LAGKGKDEAAGLKLKLELKPIDGPRRAIRCNLEDMGGRGSSYKWVGLALEGEWHRISLGIEER